MARSLVVILLVSPSVALAAPPWTAGVHLGTNFIPNGYPIAFPPKVESYDFDEDEEGLPDDVDGDGTPDATTLHQVRPDLLIGVDGHRWISGGGRLGLAFNLDVGSRFTDLQALATFDKTWDVQTLFLEAGFGFGFSSTTWVGEDAEERLRLPGYPLRISGGVIGPASPGLGLEAKLLAQMVIPSNHRYTDTSGAEQDIGGVPFTYVTIGLQLGVLFGRFDHEEPEPVESPPLKSLPPPPRPAEPARPEPSPT